MNETLVYDAARDAGGGLSIGTLGTAAIILGFILMCVPTVQLIRKRPEKRLRGLIGLGLIAVIAVASLFGLPALEARSMRQAKATTIEGVIGSVSPKLITVGIMKVMVSCSDTTRCPGVAPGDRVRVEFIDDSGPETDALATHIWKRSSR